MNRSQTLLSFSSCAPTGRGEWDDADEVGALTNAADNAAGPHQFISYPLGQPKLISRSEAIFWVDSRRGGGRASRVGESVYIVWVK